ncbi:hypothetical protein [Saccharicrinis aurantiacus]|uniref:hypothetical protein n=1 Tax=Saccharicrinis aurantiacus TaxID=1849719 RepID=UPI0009500CED|nr:hypothetical protein [Saccharicrinis aurantiacus]
MKKLLLVFAVFALIMASCKEETKAPAEEAYAEFAVVANDADLVTLKNAPLMDDMLPMCDPDLNYAEAYDHATIVYDIVGDDPDAGPQTVDIPVFYVDGKFVTQPIKVLLGSLSTMDIAISEFIVKDELGNALKATPHSGSDFFQFINPANGLRTITVEKFAKTEFVIDVICYDDLTYDYFGFIWFNIRPITVRSICVFGDICICEPESYMAEYLYGDDQVFTYYDQVQGGSLFDVIAKVKVIITQADGTVREFSNLEDPLNECLAVYWSDLDEESEDVTMELKVLLPVGNVLDWVSVKVITADASTDFGEDDDMLDFVIGDCHESADWVLPAHLNLPDHSVQGIQMTAMKTNYSNNYFAKFMFTGIPSGYSVLNNTYYNGWCINYGDAFPSGTTSGIKFYVVDDFGPVAVNNITNLMIDRVAWFVNNSNLFSNGVPVSGQGQLIQKIIWKICGANNNADISAIVSAVATDATYSPGYGEYKVIAFYNGNSDLQILITQVNSPCIEVFN